MQWIEQNEEDNIRDVCRNNFHAKKYCAAPARIIAVFCIW